MSQTDELRSQAKLDNQTAKCLVLDMMKIIEREDNLTGLRSSIKALPLGDAVLRKMPGEKFPRMRLRLTCEEMDELQRIGVLSNELQLTSALASGKLANGQQLSALEKLLYAVLWKNGDLGKEQHIVAGIYGKEHQQKTGTVFYEFGAYLRGKNTFIMDQHTLRCFAVASSDGEQLEQARQLELIDRTQPQHAKWMGMYVDFYERIEQQRKIAAQDFLYEIDRLFFGAGKLIKLGKNGGRPSTDVV